MKRAISAIMLCLLLTGLALPTLADDSDPALVWSRVPGEGDTTVAFHIDRLGSFFYHIWITRDGNSMGYFNGYPPETGSKVEFTTLDNTFDLIHDTDVFTDKGFAGLLPGDTIKVRVGSGANVIAHTLPTEAPKDITSFTIPGQVGNTIILDTDITVTMPARTDITALAPTIVHTGASIAPASGAARDFTGGVLYTVTAADGLTKTYTAHVVVLPVDKEILSFTIPGQVSSVVGVDTVLVTMPKGTDVRALTPEIVYTGVSIAPDSGETVDFTGPVDYTIAAADSSTYVYRVTVRAQADSPRGEGAVIPAKEAGPSYEQAIVTGVKEWANIRSAPSTDAEIIGRVSLGEGISLNRWNADESWCEVYYANGTRIGWLYGEFIRPVK